MKAAYHQVCDDCARVTLLCGFYARQTMYVRCACKRGMNLLPSLRSLPAAVPVAVRPMTISLTLSMRFCFVQCSLDDFE